MTSREKIKAWSGFDVKVLHSFTHAQSNALPGPQTWRTHCFDKYESELMQKQKGLQSLNETNQRLPVIY